MFSGIQELLIISLLLAVIFLMPRVFGKQRTTAQPRLSRRWAPQIPGTAQRLGIAITVIWPLLTAFYFEPWQKDLQWFLFVGMTPVLIGWALFWVARGTRRLP